MSTINKLLTLKIDNNLNPNFYFLQYNLLNEYYVDLNKLPKFYFDLSIDFNNKNKSSFLFLQIYALFVSLKILIILVPYYFKINQF